MTTDEWRRRDVRHVWHPFTEITAFEQTRFPIFVRAHGSTLIDMDGRDYLDGISSWWCANLGHGHPLIVEAICRQTLVLQHTLLGGASHPLAIELSERLAALAPGGLGHAMYGGDGSLAVEAALKIALQHWANLGEPARTRFIAIEDGYHGDTLGAIGAGYVEAFHAPFRDAIRPALRAASPHCNRCPCRMNPETCDIECFSSMEQLVSEHHAQCAAVIVEPLCQAAAGMRIYPAEYLRRLRRLCTARGLLLIADEIATGFGRTGAMFACELAGIVPDIMTIGKGLTGGSLPMSATLVSDAVYDAFRADAAGRPRTLCHGTTFCGNPITCAAALAALEAYDADDIIKGLPPRVSILDEGMRRVADAVGGAPMRSLGMIAAVEVPDKAGGAGRARSVAAKAMELGLLVRPLGATVYLWPPLNCSEADLKLMVEIYADAAESAGREWAPHTRLCGNRRASG